MPVPLARPRHLRRDYRRRSRPRPLERERIRAGQDLELVARPFDLGVDEHAERRGIRVRHIEGSYRYDDGAERPELHAQHGAVRVDRAAAWAALMVVLLPSREAGWTKFTSGHVLVAGGARGNMKIEMVLEKQVSAGFASL